VDVSAREVASSLAGEALLLAAAGGEAFRIGNDHLRMAPHGVYRTRDPDRWLAIAVGSEEAWQALASLMARLDLLADNRFRTETSRHANRTALDAEVERWSGTREAEAASAALQKVGVAAHLSCTAQDIVDDPHLRERGMVVDVTDMAGNTRAALSVPVRFSKSTTGLDRGTPRLGEDEEYVFGQLLGIGAEERTALIDQRVIY